MVSASRCDVGGHPATWDDALGCFVDDETGKPATFDGRPCSHCKLPPVPVAVVIAADLSHTGKTRVAIKPIDACLADLVRRMNAGATEPVTRFSCCGHGRDDGYLMLADRRRLKILKAVLQ